MVRVGAQDAKSSMVTGPRMAITTSRWTFSLLDASASAEPYRVSLFSLGWELVGVRWATYSEWSLKQLNPFYIFLHHFTIFSPRTLRIRGVCFEIVALFPLFPGQNEMATVSAVYSVLGFKLIEATDPGYPQSIPMRQTFRTLARHIYYCFCPQPFCPCFDMARHAEDQIQKIHNVMIWDSNNSRNEHGDRTSDIQWHIVSHAHLLAMVCANQNHVLFGYLLIAIHIPMFNGHYTVSSRIPNNN